MTTKIQFLGAVGTVTGSKYLVTSGKTHLLIDCGLFQGDRTWRERNWVAPPIDVSSVQAVLLTHAHVDHTGMLPRYSALGLRCPVWCTAPTAALAELIVLDSARLQEEEAEYRSAPGRSRHHPPQPLYTEAEAKVALARLRTVEFRTRTEVAPGVFATWRRMGHIMGAASIGLELDGKRIVFSGDIGRYNSPVLCDPDPVPLGDLLLIESTYGDRLHDETAVTDTLAATITRTARRGGVVLIPSFAVGCTQQILFHLRELKEAGRIPVDLPVVVDSPMAQDATGIYARFTKKYDSTAVELLRAGKSPFLFPKLHFTRDRQESIQLNRIDAPMVIISASGMLTGGRILHHLKHRIADSRTTILFVGFQPPGSRGAWIKSGAESLRVFGEEIRIRAERAEISALSAHGDQSELLRWCRESRAISAGNPGRVAVVHGEPKTAAHFATTLERDLGWSATAPAYLAEWTV